MPSINNLSLDNGSSAVIASSARTGATDSDEITEASKSRIKAIEIIFKFKHIANSLPNEKLLNETKYK